MRTSRAPATPAAPLLTVALIEASSGTLLPRLGSARAHVDKRFAVRIARQSHFVARHCAEANQAVLADFDKKSLGRHRHEMSVPHPRGLVPRRRDDARPVRAERDGVHLILMATQG